MISSSDVDIRALFKNSALPQTLRQHLIKVWLFSLVQHVCSFALCLPCLSVTLSPQLLCGLHCKVYASLGAALFGERFR